MVKIECNVKDDVCTVSVQGHADYDETGKDIVCSAVSVLVQALYVQAADKISSRVAPGDVTMNVTVKDTYIQGCLDLFISGITLIAYEYPENVKLKLS